MFAQFVWNRTEFSTFTSEIKVHIGLLYSWPSNPDCGNDLSGQPAYNRIIGNDILPKIAIFIRICRRPQAKIRDFYPDFQMTSKGILGGPSVVKLF